MGVKTKPCKSCGEPFQPFTSIARVCSVKCALVDVAEGNKRKQAKAKAASKKLERADLKKRKAALMTISDHKRRAQQEFNRYIRNRDWRKPCVSCQKPPECGQRHASHYRPRSTASQLSFNTRNVWASCAPCNSHKSGNLTEYRIELINRIGLEQVEALENNSELANFTVEYLIRLRDIFRRRANLYERIRGGQWKKKTASQ